MSQNLTAIRNNLLIVTILNIFLIKKLKGKNKIMLKKLFMEIKQRKTKKKINKIKENLVFIDRINLLIEKIENFKINFIEITIYAQDIDLTSYYLSQHNLENNSNKYYFKTKNETIIFLKKYKKIYEQRITKTKEKYGKSIPLLNGLQLNQEQALLKGTDLISTVSLKNNNNVLIKIKLTEQIENIYTSLFIINNQKSDTTSLLEFEDQQADTFTLLSDIYYDSTPTQSQQNLSSFIIDTSTNTKEQSPEEIEEIKDEKKYEFLNSENSQIVKNKLAQKVVYNI